MSSSRVSVTDSKSKFGLKADLRTSLLTADERKNLISRSIKGIILDENDIIKSAELRKKEERRRKFEERMARRLEITNPNRYIPISGYVVGNQWNKYVKNIWTSNEGIILHTVIFPEGQDSQKTSYLTARVARQKEYTLEPGVLPDTTTCPSKTFEAYLEKDCIKSKFIAANHFLVTDAQKPPDLSADTLKAENDEILRLEEARIKYEKAFDRIKV